VVGRDFTGAEIEDRTAGVNHLGCNDIQGLTGIKRAV
jgi:hypothetical protein